MSVLYTNQKLCNCSIHEQCFCHVQGRLPAWIKLPCSAALPFGAFEAVLSLPQNSQAAAAVQHAAREQSTSHHQLVSVRAAIQELQAPAELQDQVQAAFQQSSKHAVMASCWVPWHQGQRALRVSEVCESTHTQTDSNEGGAHYMVMPQELQL